MNSEREQFLNLKTPPARLNAEETAWYLGFAPHDIPILVARGLLKPLGNPTPSASKYFSAVEVQQYARDRSWLDRATKTLFRHWLKKNNRRKSPQSKEGAAL